MTRSSPRRLTKAVFEAADKVFMSSRQVNVAAVAAVAAVSGASASPNPLDETLPAFSAQNQPQVAAVSKNQNSGSGGGGKKKNKKNKNRDKPRPPRHASNPPEACCDRHYAHGDQAWYCLAPTTCPWVNKCVARP